MYPSSPEPPVRLRLRSFRIFRYAPFASFQKCTLRVPNLRFASGYGRFVSSGMHPSNLLFRKVPFESRTFGSSQRTVVSYLQVCTLCILFSGMYPSSPEPSVRLRVRYSISLNAKAAQYSFASLARNSPQLPILAP